MTTIREHLEAIRARHGRETHADNRYCGGCNRKWPCVDYEHAESALAILDGSTRYVDPDLGAASGARLIPDPEVVA